MTSGLDDNAGTKAAPFQTIQRAIDTAGLTGGSVYVAEGTYHESLVLGDNVRLYGGYKDGTFARDLENATSLIYGTAFAVRVIGADSITIAGFTINCAPDTTPGGSAIAISLDDAVAITINGNSIIALNGERGYNGHQPDPPIDCEGSHPGGYAGGNATNENCTIFGCYPTAGGGGGRTEHSAGGRGGNGCTEWCDDGNDGYGQGYGAGGEGKDSGRGWRRRTNGSYGGPEATGRTRRGSLRCDHAGAYVPVAGGDGEEGASGGGGGGVGAARS
jgi:hypothetical protein